MTVRPAPPAEPPAAVPWYEDPAHMYSPPGEPDPGCPPVDRDPLPCPACGGDVYLHLGGRWSGQFRCKDCREQLVVVAGGGGTENGCICRPPSHSGHYSYCPLNAFGIGGGTENGDQR